MFDALKRLGMLTLRTVVVGILVLAIALGSSHQPAIANTLISGLPPGNAVTDGRALLRYALPTNNQKMFDVQANIEEMSDVLRVSRRSLRNLNPNLIKAERVLNRRETLLLPSVPEEEQDNAESIINEIQDRIASIRTDIEENDREAIWIERRQILSLIGELEAMMVQGFPFEIPAEYSNLPQLKGRATVEMETSQGSVTIVLDGFNAPITAGNFADLVQRGFYDGLEFIRADNQYYIQAGDPPGEAEGFIDPDTGEYRAIPIEIMVKGENEPIYEITLEQAGLYLDPPALPFSAYGTVAMARPADDPNGGSSQFFFFLFEPELTPAGYNLLDGRYAAFGYVIDGKDVLSELRQGDVIESAKLVDGAENLVLPS